MNTSRDACPACVIAPHTHTELQDDEAQVPTAEGLEEPGNKSDPLFRHTHTYTHTHTMERESAATGRSSLNPNHADPTRRSGGRGGGGGRPQLEGILSKYTNLIQGWQYRYFVLDEELNQLQYFVNEQGRSLKPRGTIPLIGASVTVSDEAPHMFVVSSANGELFKVRAVDGREQQLWMSHIQSCSTDSSVRTLKDTDEQLDADRIVSSLDTQGSPRRSFSLLPSASSSSSSSPRLQRHLPHVPYLPHLPHPHRSPASPRRAKHTHVQPDALLQVREVIDQIECQQKSLVHAIELLPRRGGVSCLDQDLLLLKATSAATLRCLAQCLSMLQQHRHAQSQTHPAQTQAPPFEDPNADDVKPAGGPEPLLSQHHADTC